jgi:hypothetical protein
MTAENFLKNAVEYANQPTNKRRYDGHGTRLAGEIPAIALLEGKMYMKARVSIETLSSYLTGKHGYFEPMRNMKEALAKSVNKTQVNLRKAATRG